MTDRPTDDPRVIYEPVLINEQCMDVEYQGGGDVRCAEGLCTDPPPDLGNTEALD